MSKIILVENNDGFEGLYVDGVLVDEGNTINEGTERVIYFLEQCKKYNISIDELEFKQTAKEEFTHSIIELGELI